MAEPVVPTLALFRVLYPEFSSVSDVTVEFYLDDNACGMSQSSWGRCYAKAALYMTAHQIALSQARIASTADSGGAAVVSPTGVVQSASAEGLSVSFAVPQNRSEYASWLGQTPYGQELLALQRQCLSRGRLSW